MLDPHYQSLKRWASWLAWLWTAIILARKWVGPLARQKVRQEEASQAHPQCFQKSPAIEGSDQIILGLFECNVLEVLDDSEEEEDKGCEGEVGWTFSWTFRNPLNGLDVLVGGTLGSPSGFTLVSFCV